MVMSQLYSYMTHILYDSYQIEKDSLCSVACCFCRKFGKIRSPEQMIMEQTKIERIIEHYKINH